ncbi:hypothetical protein CA13_28680 [Planctomycetes bacterium CA13]|uniref:Glycosyl hydrolases family 43 n=1 Tax=Novipirellula herctigrandis TaxID=2527986 RepID=A0A5C5Z2J3_9BACT|nr:hypothetical protein CA13_28680 [Planctomycetes bacterium CA13]
MRNTRLVLAGMMCLASTALYGQSGETNYQLPEGLVRGGAFIDRFLPVPIKNKLQANVWGAGNVIPRDTDNGIEDAEYSYWGGNIIVGDDGKNHLFVCRWREDEPKGHHIWWKSDVVHAVSDDPLGPYQVVEEIGRGHNPEIYRLKDGTYIIGVMGYSAYRADSLDGPWTKIETVLESPQEKFNKSNRTYVVREDGSVLMMNKNGYVSIGDTGVERFHQVANQSVYPKIKNHFEDPVIWKDEVQYHLVVNDWYTRKAFYLRSPDGINWKWDPGFAYDTTMMKHEGGTSEAWYKFERPKVRQDKYGRATHMNFAVIDVPKDDDRGSDNHSSKNIVIPLVVPRRIHILNTQPITADTDHIDVRILAEPGFDPQTEIVASSLRFGASEEVNFGRGSSVLTTKVSGNDLIITFDVKGHGLTANNFVAKLLGRNTDDDLLFGYASLPGSTREN